jgi:3'-phosphoadenosine 5'-phosphosulfate sulfotransferase (PAPS reductase)/FAD synthetase
MFPPAQYRQCTSDLKRGPIEKYIRRLPHPVVVNCIGIRAEESNARSRFGVLELNRSLTRRTRSVYNWLRSSTRRSARFWHGIGSMQSDSIRCMCPSTTRTE